MAVVTRARAQSIAYRNRHTIGGDIHDLLETNEKLIGALKETLELLDPALSQEHARICQHNRTLLDGLAGTASLKVYHPVAVCIHCSWEHHFRRIIGVGEALIVSALLEEAQALHIRHSDQVRVELRPGSDPDP